MLGDVIKHIKKGSNKKTIVEIGSYIGDNAITISKKIPGASIYCIEADPTNFEILKKNTQNFNNIHSFNAAITNHCDQTNFYVSSHPKKKGTSLSNSLFVKYIKSKKWAQKVNEICVNATTLDKFCSANDIDRIDLLKINCEGCEYKIFDSYDLKFLNITKSIMIQLHKKNKEFNSSKFEMKRKQIKKILKLAKFQLIRNVDKHHILQLWVKNENSIS